MAENQEILAVLERRFTDLAGRIDESRTETRDRFDRLEGEVRNNGVQIEALRGDIRQVAEGVVAVDEKLTKKLDGFSLDLQREAEETRSLIRLSYRQLEQRVTSLESRYEQVDSRLTALEAAQQ